MPVSSKSVVFICSFNIARSVVAEHFFRRVLQERGLAHRIKVSSAAVLTKEVLQKLKDRGIPLLQPMYGRKTSGNVLKLMADRGIDLSDHRTKPLSRPMAEKADLIITMDEQQKRKVLSLYPATEGKVFNLKEFLGETKPSVTEDSLAVFPYDPDYGSYVYPYESGKAMVIEIEQYLSQGWQRFLSYLLPEEGSHG